jgi:hypothetical protein
MAEGQTVISGYPRAPLTRHRKRIRLRAADDQTAGHVGSRGLADVHTASPARRMVQSIAWSSLLELEAVSKRVERVEPEHALYFVIRARRLVPRQSYRSFNDIEVLHDKRRVCLAGGSKIRLDAKVKNGRASREPASTTRRERCGLGQLDHPEQSAVIVTGDRLRAARNRNLDVVVANDHDLSFIHHGVIVDVQASRCERTLLLEMGVVLVR